MKNKKSKIEILVELDENKIPEKIHWSASDAGIKNSETKATFLSVWDSNRKESLIAFTLLLSIFLRLDGNKKNEW